MTHDTEQLFEELAKAYPELMEKSRIAEHIGVDPGWSNIIRSLCKCIYNPLQQAKYCLAGATAYHREDSGAYLNKCTQEVVTATEELPSIEQIKEKFGTLRFYYSGGNDRVATLVAFAEAMSACTCETCGDVGKLDHAGWIKVCCAKHRRPDINEDLYGGVQDGTVSPKFQDDEV